jgi:hypothetical protein
VNAESRHSTQHPLRQGRASFSSGAEANTPEKAPFLKPNMRQFKQKALSPPNLR